MAFWDRFFGRGAAPSAPPAPALSPSTEDVARLVEEARLEGLLRADAVTAQILGGLVNDVSGAGTEADPTTAWKPPDLSAPALHPWQLLATYVTTIGANVVDLPPVWQNVAGVQVDDDASDPAPLQRLWTDLDVDLTFKAAAQWGRLFGGGGCLLVTDEGPNPPPLSEPLDPARVRGIEALEVYDGWELRVVERGRRPGDQRRGLPTMYQIDAVDGWHSQYIHWSRVLEFYGHPLPPGAMGWVGTWLEWPAISVLQVCWSALRSYESQGARNDRAADRASTYIVKQPNHESIKSLDKDAFGRLKSQISQKLGVYGTLFGPPGFDVTTASLNLAGFPGLNEASYTRLSAISRIPLALLFTTPPPGLSTDEKSWWAGWTTWLTGQWYADYARNYRRLHALTAGLVYERTPRLSHVGPGEYRKPTDAEVMALRKLGVEEAKAAIDAGIATEDQFQRGRYGDSGFNVHLPPPAERAIEQPVQGQGAPAATTKEDVQATALNGAQTLAVEPEGILPSYRAGKMTREGALALLRIANPGADLTALAALVDGQVVSALPTPAPVATTSTPATPAASPATAPAQADAEVLGTTDAPKDTSVEKFALQMTEKGVGQCAHGMKNRCRICRIERVWTVEIVDGQATWPVQWKAIGSAVQGDADWLGTAYVYLALDDVGVAAWRDLQAKASAVVPLEGYDPGDPILEKPHLTLHYLGEVKGGDQADVVAAVTATLGGSKWPALRGVGVACYPPEDGRVPVVVELGNARIRPFADALLNDLQKWTTAEQHPHFRAHLTLGYAKVTDEQMEALEALAVPEDMGSAVGACLDWDGQRVLGPLGR